MALTLQRCFFCFVLSQKKRNDMSSCCCCRVTKVSTARRDIPLCLEVPTFPPWQRSERSSSLPKASDIPTPVSCTRLKSLPFESFETLFVFPVRKTQTEASPNLSTKLARGQLTCFGIFPAFCSAWPRRRAGKSLNVFMTSDSSILKSRARDRRVRIIQAGPTTSW